MVGRSNFLLNWSLFWGHVNFPGGMPSCINEPCCREECQRRNHENNFKIWNTVLITTCCNWKMPKMAILTGHESTSKKIDYGVENSGELNFMLDSNLLRGLFFSSLPSKSNWNPKFDFAPPHVINRTSLDQSLGFLWRFFKSCFVQSQLFSLRIWYSFDLNGPEWQQSFQSWWRGKYAYMGYSKQKAFWH